MQQIHQIICEIGVRPGRICSRPIYPEQILGRNLAPLAIIVPKFDGIGAGLIYNNHNIKPATACVNEGPEPQKKKKN